MASYPYAWLPVVIVVGTVVVLSNAYLALIALLVVLPAVLVAVAAAIVSVPYVLGRYAGRRWREHGAARTPRAWFTAPSRIREPHEGEHPARHVGRE
jgi:hypothetical protein